MSVCSFCYTMSYICLDIPRSTALVAYEDRFRKRNSMLMMSQILNMNSHRRIRQNRRLYLTASLKLGNIHPTSEKYLKLELGKWKLGLLTRGAWALWRQAKQATIIPDCEKKLLHCRYHWFRVFYLDHLQSPKLFCQMNIISIFLTDYMHVPFSCMQDKWQLIIDPKNG